MDKGKEGCPAPHRAGRVELRPGDWGSSPVVKRWKETKNEWVGWSW